MSVCPRRHALKAMYCCAHLIPFIRILVGAHGVWLRSACSTFYAWLCKARDLANGVSKVRKAIRLGCCGCCCATLSGALGVLSSALIVGSDCEEWEQLPFVCCSLKERYLTAIHRRAEKVLWRVGGDSANSLNYWTRLTVHSKTPTCSRCQSFLQSSVERDFKTVPNLKYIKTAFRWLVNGVFGVIFLRSGALYYFSNAPSFAVAEWMTNRLHIM